LNNLALEPTPQRRAHGQGLMKETLAYDVARYKARVPFTLLEARRRIMDEAKDKPKEKRERSLRRRLTPFDRALSEDEATVIDMLIRAFLSFERVKGASWSQGVDASHSPKLPFAANEHKLLAAFGLINSRLAAKHRAILRDLLQRMAPDHEAEKPIDFHWIAAAKNMAAAALAIFENKTGK
jgi:hypothetical protein